MIFRECSIGGRVYIGDESPDMDTSTPKKEATPVEILESGTSATNPAASSSLDSDDTRPAIPADETLFHSTQLLEDISKALHVDQNSEYAAHARLLNGFFTVLALCHTVLTSYDHTTKKISYKAQSPDEAALVKAAAESGYVFMGREKEIMTLQKPSSDPNEEGPLEKYELLNILEFTSARKRMSVVLRKLDGDDGRLFLLTKGADNVIFERLRKGGDDSLKDLTEMHLNEFANGGLRTLTLAYKIIGGTKHTTFSIWISRR